ncbi:MetQ/NlpA family ABC transporter substrate-binding protein [Oligella ureolytica]
MINCFQHKPHLDSFNKNEGQDLVPQGYMYILPLGAYSTKIKALDELKDRASVAIPSDTTNGARALLLLQKAGLITLKDPGNLFATARDISDNPKVKVCRAGSGYYSTCFK